MSKLIAAALLSMLQLLLSLAGCQFGARDFSDRISRDGHAVLDSRAHVEAGVARFQCVASASGRCHYTLFAAPCTAAAAAVGRPGCGDTPLRRLTVARGQTRQLSGLPAFQLCVATVAGAVARDCRPLPASAAR